MDAIFSDGARDLLVLVSAITSLVTMLIVVSRWDG